MKILTYHPEHTLCSRLIDVPVHKWSSIWCDLNKWNWPTVFDDIKPSDWNTLPLNDKMDYISEAMAIITETIGEKECSREWNKDRMTLREFEVFWTTRGDIRNYICTGKPKGWLNKLIGRL